MSVLSFRLTRRTASVAALALVGLTSAGCTQLRSHQGYVVDVDLVNSVQPGVDNRQSVLQTLGKPTLAGQFDQGDWYYLARDSRNLALPVTVLLAALLLVAAVLLPPLQVLLGTTAPSAQGWLWGGLGLVAGWLCARALSAPSRRSS